MAQTFRGLVSAAQELKNQQNQLKGEAFTEYTFNYGDDRIAFYASFNVETCKLEFNILRNDFEVKLLQELEPDLLVVYADFIRTHRAWEDGLSERPVFVSQE